MRTDQPRFVGGLGWAGIVTRVSGQGADGQTDWRDGRGLTGPASSKHTCREGLCCLHRLGWRLSVFIFGS